VPLNNPENGYFWESPTQDRHAIGSGLWAGPITSSIRGIESKRASVPASSDLQSDWHAGVWPANGMEIAALLSHVWRCLRGAPETSTKIVQKAIALNSFVRLTSAISTGSRSMLLAP
jgi:hypothetical protein